MNNFIWEKFDNPKLNELKKICKLENTIAEFNNEFDQQITLNTWVHNKLPLGGDYKDYGNLTSFEILEDLERGMQFRCTQYTQLFLQCAISLGWYTRKLGVDVDHQINEKDMHHGVCDIWSSTHNKWYVLDPMNNLHFEKNGLPLNSLEIRNEYIKNSANDIKGIIGARDHEISFDNESKGFNTPSNYFWFFISQRNNFIEKPGLFDTKAYLWVDKNNEDKKWYKNGKLHDMYNGRFIEVDDIETIFPKI